MAKRKMTAKELLNRIKEAKKDKEFMKEVDEMIKLTSHPIKVK